MARGVQIFTGVETRCRQYAGAVQLHNNRSFAFQCFSPVVHRCADNRDRMSVGAHLNLTLIDVEHAVAVKVVEELAVSAFFRSQAAVQLHHKGHRHAAWGSLQHFEQLVRHGVGCGIGDFISAARQVHSFL